MQLKYSLIVIFFSLILLIPSQELYAESRHFDADQANAGSVFLSDDETFKLEIGAQEFNQSMDVYLFNKPSTHITDLNVLSNIYSYYIYSKEVNQDSEFTITISYNGSHSSGKTVYYYNTQKKLWEMASTRAFLNNLTFKLKGKKNQIIIVGTNLVEISANQEDESQIPTIYSFDVNSETSELDTEKVCLPYINSYFRNSTDNNREEVKKLQTFLNKYEGHSDLPSTGYYGVMTYAAVKEFQEKYSKDILASWGLTSGTGWVLKTTQNKINQLYCEVYNKDNFYYELTIPYEIADKNAKIAYYLDKSKVQEGEWVELESFDDSKNKRVTAIIDKESGEVSLFKSQNQWVGEASWYLWKGGLFAASRDFPKGTKLKVTNQSNSKNRGKSVVVTVNDYGPELWTGRIIDLDKVAFSRIAYPGSGLAPVRVELVEE